MAKNMTDGYGFTITLPKTEGFRTEEFITFLRLMSEILGVSGWLDIKGRQVLMTPEYIDILIHKEYSSNHLANSGVEFCFRSIEGQPPIVTSMTTGWEYSDDYFNVGLSNIPKMPSLNSFLRCIESLSPVEAHISHYENVSEIVKIRNQRGIKVRKKPPYMLDWFTYIAEYFTNDIGGIEHCLATPVYKVERFFNGLIFQLTEELFDVHNPTHLQIQIRAMEHLGLL
jgi:hypothetical protein